MSIKNFYIILLHTIMTYSIISIRKNEKKVNNIYNILNLIYPEVCFWCEDISKESPCKKCQKELDEIAKYHNKYLLDEIEYAYLFKYEGKIRQKILDYKFNEKVYLKNGFASLFLQNKKMCQFLKKFDIICPVPIHKKRIKQRGYNQSKLIAKQIAKNITNLKFKNNLIKKIQNNKPQSSLNRESRKQNVQNVYSICRKEQIQGKNILLFDDIYTTGSTIKECAKILKNAGANKIGAVTIAKD